MKLRSEEEILGCLNSVTGNKIREISLVYDLSVLFQLDKEKATLMKKLQSLPDSTEHLRGDRKKSRALLAGL